LAIERHGNGYGDETDFTTKDGKNAKDGGEAGSGEHRTANIERTTSDEKE